MSCWHQHVQITNPWARISSSWKFVWYFLIFGFPYLKCFSEKGVIFFYLKFLRFLQALVTLVASNPSKELRLGLRAIVLCSSWPFKYRLWRNLVSRLAVTIDDSAALVWLCFGFCWCLIFCLISIAALVLASA